MQTQVWYSGACPWIWTLVVNTATLVAYLNWRCNLRYLDFFWWYVTLIIISWLFLHKRAIVDLKIVCSRNDNRSIMLPCFEIVLVTLDHGFNLYRLTNRLIDHSFIQHRCRLRGNSFKQVCSWQGVAWGLFRMLACQGCLVCCEIFKCSEVGLILHYLPPRDWRRAAYWAAYRFISIAFPLLKATIPATSVWRIKVPKSQGTIVLRQSWGVATFWVVHQGRFMAVQYWDRKRLFAVMHVWFGAMFLPTEITSFSAAARLKITIRIMNLPPVLFHFFWLDTGTIRV